MKQPLASRIEEASLNAWPALKQVLLDGWVLRFAQGFTKRSNCVVPLYPSSAGVGTMRDHDALITKVRYCENLYSAQNLQSIFRLSSIEPDQGPSHKAALDPLLAERGYRFIDPSVVLSAALHDAPPAIPQLQMLTLEQWLHTYARLTGMPEPGHTLHRLILQSISGPCGFAALFDGERPLACGLGVLDGELVGLFDIFTDPQARHQGHGRSLVSGLMQWARQHGANRAYLQMVRSNTAAAGLYAQLGFEEIYNYWYRSNS